MSAAASIFDLFGDEPGEADDASFAKRWITPELARGGGLRRADSYTVRSMFGRKKGDLSGILIPNVAPWAPGHAREYRARLDHPELEYRIDGTIKETNRYLQPPDRPNLLYFPPGVMPSLLDDAALPLIITEGEFKALALWRLANYKADSPRFLPVAVAGVWNFRGTIGKTVGPNGDRRDVKGIIPDIDKIALKGRRVIIAFDADSEQNAKVRAARWKLTEALTERGATVGTLSWPIDEGKGIDDRLAAMGPDRVLADIAAVEFGDWHMRLIRNEDGRVMPCYDNVALFLENSPDWAGVLSYNEFTAGYFVLKPPPAPITAEAGAEIEDHFDTEVVRWLERKRLMVRPELVRRVVDLIGRRNAYHPVRDYLDGLPRWDGVRRIGTWLIDYCGVESSDERPNRYAMVVGEKFLISAVKRILEPGAKCDSMIVLEGPQGLGKSTVGRILAGDEWFSDKLSELGSKDSSMQLRGVWMMELAELEALDRAAMAQVKAFISQQVERFRLPYGRRVIVVPRSCVFLGTTNSEVWLKDESGGRRFWPVRCHRIDMDGLRRDRDQLWAEALVQCRSGATWWLDEADVIKDAVEEQRGRYMEDPWQAKVIECAEDVASTITTSPRGTASIAEILQRMNIDVAKQDQAAANRVVRCLKHAGWERRRGPENDDGKRPWIYVKVSQS